MKKGIKFRFRYILPHIVWRADRTAIDSLVSQTRVLLNTAGPFALYGDTIVDACIRYRTHYVDIMGVKFVCESALCLAVDFDSLPGWAGRGGILTPATGLGDVLVERLRQAGMRIEVEIIQAKT